MKSRFYDMTFNDAHGEPFDTDLLRDKVVIIVNTASECGFRSQLESLEHLYQKYKDEGLVILGFPSSDFRNQEPLNSKDAESCYRENHGVTFPIMEKVHVRGKDIHPLFKALTESRTGLLTSAIKWNYTKFLVSREGKIMDRYPPQKKPEQFEEDVKKTLRYT
ncbi:glutathione peroxidase [Corticicoccus populi]|uniref:Glutathione peroxidase n=1 Tax=Corticicoccus populi TaxID=1812821 RepID=A0ABW5WQD5_9STAP